MPAGSHFDELLEQAAGFPGCKDCTFRETGASALCFACASRDLNPPDDESCLICDQTLPPSGICVNNWCSEPVSIRHFQTVWAVAKHTGQLRTKIHAFKYSNRHGWAQIFGRILVGYLDETADAFREYGLITGVPGFVDPPRTYDPVSLMLARAASEAGDRWPFDVTDPAAIIKTSATPSMTTTSSLTERKELARTQLREALQVPDPSRVDGIRVLVVDDVFTEGSTLREVARALLAAGAMEVSGLVLARQPWQP